MSPFGHYLVFILLLSTSVSNVFASSYDNAKPLKLEQHWALSGVENLQPSGLSVCGAKLIMVSDRHSDKIFSIPLSNKPTTEVETYRTLSPFTDLPEQIRWQERLMDWGLRWTQKRFDWEGIHCNPDGTIFLASESLSAVATVEPDGSSRWITPSFINQLRTHTFASSLNTGFEGIAADEQQLYLAIEREPRGLLSVSMLTLPPRIDNLKIVDQEGVISPLSADFTGLWLEKPSGQPVKIYTLERNYFRVCRRHYDTWEIEVCWRYRDTEKSTAFRFESDHFGLAEGIARLGDAVYIVLDNNDQPRRLNSSRNPLLFKFKRPDNW
ncbi:SdiA-regulated domain-containing protein [Alkalimarinus sediminis]|uniref:SdiA-regulated domain-containing protein n=1 Tax=Alkalimarinus sediminis TaxID=1632866 RepID=A0A9E8KQ83_9ALTE|nr:SdiA-regulated domain-containing protein [Alkalimarinus sediminis]UZW74930.1 SdiA-regulated domain-containing protein [Alkalimarinus sediminis]